MRTSSGVLRGHGDLYDKSMYPSSIVPGSYAILFMIITCLLNCAWQRTVCHWRWSIMQEWDVVMKRRQLFKVSKPSSEAAPHCIAIIKSQHHSWGKALLIQGEFNSYQNYRVYAPSADQQLPWSTVPLFCPDLISAFLPSSITLNTHCFLSWRKKREVEPGVTCLLVAPDPIPWVNSSIGFMQMLKSMRDKVDLCGTWRPRERRRRPPSSSYGIYLGRKKQSQLKGN